LVSRCHHNWSQNHHKLVALSPTNVLARGFSILKDSQGQIVRNYEQIRPGDQLVALLKVGKLLLRVESYQSTWTFDHQE
jgi:exonuclease VII large subunit